MVNPLPPLPFTTRPELRGSFGMVATTHWLASASGMSVLERGGNAFDAAVAAGFVLQVVEPHLNGPGGEVPILLRRAGSDQVQVVCGQGVAPRAATISAFADLGLDMVPGTGFLPACVPGAFGAWLLMLRDFGSWRLRDVMDHAIGYARGGYSLLPRIADTIATVESLFREEWLESARVYLGGGVPAPGSVFRNLTLAAAYERIVHEAEAHTGDRDGQIEKAREVFYSGFVADSIDSHLRETEAIDVSGERHRGLLTGDDMTRWRATLDTSQSADYRRFRVFKTRPWGQGPVFLQQLRLLEGFDLSGMGFNSADHIHTVIECAKLAFADREAWYGDPDFGEIPIEALLDCDYADHRRRLVSDGASLELRPGSVGGRVPRVAWGDRAGLVVSPADAPGLGDPTVTMAGESRGDTCHMDVIDRDGNMVSATPSGGWLQSSPCIPGLGFPLNNRGQIFNLTEGLPNALAPGKRPRTTLSPSLAFKDGEPYLAFGTPGADQQDQWSLNFFIAHVDFGLNLQEAIDAPMFNTMHFPNSFYPHQAFPGRVVVEERLDGEVVEDLRRRGHDVVVQGPWTLGRISAAGRDLETGLLKAAANPRGMQGYAAGR